MQLKVFIEGVWVKFTYIEGPRGQIKFQNSQVSKGRLKNNKAFFELGSCDNVQTERSIFKYSNWPKLQK